MRGTAVVTAYRMVGALLILVAVGYQMSVNAAKGGFEPVSFFSFFTTLSNLITVAALLAAAARPSRAVDLLRGAAVVYMVTTFVVVVILLSSADLQVAVPWVDFVVHKLMPVAIVLDWLLVAPSRHLPLGRTMLWLAFPVMWLAYTLIRGAIVGWYPYPFLNPALTNGYGAVAVTCLVIAAGMVALTLLVGWIGNARWRTRVRR